jgi:predicted transcriptional regulator
VANIEELKDVIRKLHGVESTHVTSVPVKETFNGETVWDGIVEIFSLHGHPKANTAYAWTHATDDPNMPKRSVVVLHVPPAVSPITAVRVAILQELKELRADAEATEA